MQSRYLPQAIAGQAELLTTSRPLEAAIRDPSTSPGERALLREVPAILEFAAARGLESKGNYRRYVDLKRDAVVWFMTASEPLAFEAVTWRFPIVGSFPYLGWFDVRDARDARRRLERRGLDVFMRPVRAYSTGGWFDDPLLSTMLRAESGGLSRFANVLFHELTHANLLVRDQSIFNESLASFVGDGITEDFLTARFGPGSPELAAFRDELWREHDAGRVLAAAYRTLDAIYRGGGADSVKRSKKKVILERLERDLELSFRPNNGFLIGFRTYNSGERAFQALYQSCGRSWPAFLEVLESLRTDDFSEPQAERFDAQLLALRPRCGRQATRVDARREGE